MKSDPVADPASQPTGGRQHRFACRRSCASCARCRIIWRRLKPGEPSTARPTSPSIPRSRPNWPSAWPAWTSSTPRRVTGARLRSKAISVDHAATASPAPLGDFRIMREIGRGGMGVVYEAMQLSLGRRVALKVLPFAAALDPKQLQRFKNEAQAAAQLHHTNIVPVYAVGCERGVHFYAMQLIQGHSLSVLIRQMRPWPAAMATARPAAARVPWSATWRWADWFPIGPRPMRHRPPGREAEPTGELAAPWDNATQFAAEAHAGGRSFAWFRDCPPRHAAA